MFFIWARGHLFFIFVIYYKELQIHKFKNFAMYFLFWLEVIFFLFL